MLVSSGHSAPEALPLAVRSPGEEQATQLASPRTVPCGWVLPAGSYYNPRDVYSVRHSICKWPTLGKGRRYAGNRPQWTEDQAPSMQEEK